MKYLVTMPEHEPFLSDRFDYDNHFVEGMVIYDLVNYTYTVNGKDWEQLNIDHL